MKHLVITLLLSALCIQANAIEPFELNDQDRIILLGNTLIERAASYGHFETALLMRWPDRKLTFRNLGWAADNVQARSRDYFFKTGEGYKRLVQQVTAFKPTVIFVAYGTNESFSGEDGLAAFNANFEKLLADLGKTHAQLILLSPLKQAPWHPAATVEKNNQNLLLYSDAIQAAAKKHALRFVNLYRHEELSQATYNSIHLDDKGYSVFARVVEEELGLKPLVHENSSAIRQLVIEKNRLHFHQWRPTNEAYLFGHRKHEQGRNGKEMAMFTPLIEAKEKEIDALRLAASGESK